MRSMVKNGNHRPMSQPERKFWSEIFQIAHREFLARFANVSADQAVPYAEKHADAAVDAYRKRITWRGNT